VSEIYYGLPLKIISKNLVEINGIKFNIQDRYISNFLALKKQVEDLGIEFHWLDGKSFICEHSNNKGMCINSKSLSSFFYGSGDLECGFPQKSYGICFN